MSLELLPKWEPAPPLPLTTKFLIAVCAGAAIWGCVWLIAKAPMAFVIGLAIGLHSHGR